jgi:hopene-associated glycosyltransferase HpnB
VRSHRKLMAMHSFLLALGLCPVLVWAYLLLARGAFWRVKDKLAPENTQISLSARAAIVVPARNEADVIQRTLVSLLSQSSDHSLHVFLVDDGSVDGTAEVAREAAIRVGKSDSLTIVEGKPLPAGWSGKLWAMEQGIARARELSPQFLLFTDADIVHASDNISTLIGLAEKGKYDLVSLMVKLHCKTTAEKLLIPAFVFFFFKLYPPKWIADTRRRTAGAAGGCVLIRPEALARAGGVTAIRGEIIDDCALARRVKQSGGRLWLGLTASTYSARPYRSFTEIGSMISRTAFNQLHHSLAILCGALVGLVLTYLLPVMLLFFGKWAALVAMLAWLLMTAAYLPLVRFYKLNILWAATLPFAALFYMGATLHSAIQYWAGSGGRWKGRVQDPVTS